jgi:hypothetical protein
VPSLNLFAGRASFDATSKLRVGVLLTNGDPAGLRRNSLLGFDAVWRSSAFRGNKNLLLGAWTATSAGELPPGSQTGWGFKMDYPNDLLDCSTSVNQFGESLVPALGFLPRPGTRMSQYHCSLKPRPSKLGPFHWIRQMFFENGYYRTTDYRGITESWGVSVTPLRVQLESGDRIGFSWSPQYEYLTSPFEIVPGVVVPPGPYNFTRWATELHSSEHRSWHFGAFDSFGSFYSGTLSQYHEFLLWTSPRGRFQIGGEATNNFGHLKEGNFVQKLYQFNFTYAWNPNLVLTSFIQYDSETQNLGTNTRLRWTIKPGNDLFIVWNRGWQRLVTDPHEIVLAPDTESLTVKLRWTFRM